MFLSTTRKKLFVITTGLVALIASGAIASSAQAQDYTLDFENVKTNADGTLLTTQWSDWGLKNISGTNKRTNKAAKFNTYNTAKRGRDNDLRTGSQWGTANQGNVLIIQEEDGRSFRNGVYKADDEARGGNINFDFDKAIKLNSFVMLDIDDNGEGINFTGLGEDNQTVIDFDIDALMGKLVSTYGNNHIDAYNKSVTLNGVTMTQKSKNRHDNSLFEFSFLNTYVSNINFAYPGSGAIADIKWSTVDSGITGASTKVPEPAGVAGLFLVSGLVGRSLRKRKQSM